MTPDSMNAVFSLFTTYFIHSTIFIGLTWALIALKVVRAGAMKETLWRFALLAAFVTAPLQMVLPVEPVLGKLALTETAPVAAGQTIATPDKSAAGGDALSALPAAQNASPLTPATEDNVAAAQPATSAFRPVDIALLVWAGFALALLFRLGVSAFDLRWQLKSREALGKGAAAAMLQRLAARAGLPSVRLSVSPSLTTPFCLPNGEIVIPDWAVRLPRPRLKAMLAHEVAHLKRRDPVWIIAGQVVQSVFFFQPLNFVARRNLEAAAEYACDEWASKACGTGRSLAEAIAECARRYLHGPSAAFGSAMAGSSSEAVKRAERLLKNVREFSSPVGAPAKAALVIAFIGAALLLPAFGISAAMEKATTQRSSHISIEDDGEVVMNISFSDGARTLKVKGAGKITLNDAETGIESLNEDGFLDIAETRDGKTRRVRWEGKTGGKIVQTFWRDGAEVPADNEMTRWLADVIPAVYRETGIDAEGRTRRIYNRAGAAGVADEIELISSSYTKRAYATALVGMVDLNAKDLARLLESAKGIDASYDLRETLTAVAATQKMSAEDWRTYATTAAKISSSYDLRETLSQAAAYAGSDAGVWHEVLRAAEGISSSYDLRETLVSFQRRLPKTPEMLRAYAAAASKISSSYDLRSVLEDFAKSGELDHNGWLTMLDLAKSVRSDYDTRSVLETYARRMPKDPALDEKYREVLATIRSDHDRSEAEKALTASRP